MVTNRLTIDFMPYNIQFDSDWYEKQVQQIHDKEYEDDLEKGQCIDCYG